MLLDNILFSPYNFAKHSVTFFYRSIKLKVLTKYRDVLKFVWLRKIISKHNFRKLILMYFFIEIIFTVEKNQ